MRRAVKIGIAASFLAGLVGCGEVALEPIGDHGDAIVGGSPLEHPAAVRLVGAGSCMGTLVAPNVVLTAKHCVVGFVGGGPFDCDDNGELVVDPDAPIVFVGAGEFLDEPMPPETFSVGSFPQSPRGEAIFVSEGESICASDTALVVLDQAVDDPTLAPLRLDALPAVGDALTAVGHGQHEGGEQSDELLATEVTVLALGPEPAVAEVSGAVTPGSFATSEGPCRGDSGSAAFADSGAAVGVASSVGRPDLEVPTGGYEDCIGSRASFAATAAEAALIEEALAYAGASPWLEGEPDPRADLAELEEPCVEDADCKSNVCVADADGDFACSHGCEATACPEGYGCEEVDGRLRCVASPPPASAAAGEATSEGCALSPGRSRSHGGAILLLLLASLVRGRRRAR